MNVVEFIEFVVELTDEELYQKLTNTSARAYFLTNYGSLEFAKILKNFYEEGRIVVSKNNFNFAFNYLGNVYNANGKVEEKNNYIEIIQKDINYVEDKLKFYEFVVNNEDVSEHIIKEIPKCNVLHKLQK